MAIRVFDILYISEGSRASLCQKPDPGVPGRAARLGWGGEGGPDSRSQPELESQFASTDYGAKTESVSVCWRLRTTLPFGLRFLLMPIRAGEDEEERLKTVSEAAATATG